MDKAEEGNGPAEVRSCLLPLSKACGKGKCDTSARGNVTALCLKRSLQPF